MKVWLEIQCLPTQTIFVLLDFFFFKEIKYVENQAFIYSLCISWHRSSLRTWSFRWIQRMYKSHIIAILCHNLKDTRVWKYNFTLNIFLPFLLVFNVLSVYTNMSENTKKVHIISCRKSVSRIMIMIVWRWKSISYHCHFSILYFGMFIANFLSLLYIGVKVILAYKSKMHIYTT